LAGCNPTSSMKVVFLDKIHNFCILRI
jgi:hypothetical protein